jgi:hypothetical protein
MTDSLTGNSAADRITPFGRGPVDESLPYATGSAIGEFNATTGAAINRNFITGHSSPYDLRFVAPVPEPSSLLLVAAAAGIGLVRRKHLAPGQ